MLSTFAIQPEDENGAGLDESDAVQFGIYDDTDDHRHGAAGASFVIAYPTRELAERRMAALIRATRFGTVPTYEATGLCEALDILEPLGFTEEVAGGGALVMSLHLENGAHVWASEYESAGMPTPDNFGVSVYPPGWDGEECAFDLRRCPDYPDEPEGMNKAVTLQRAAEAAVTFALSFSPLSDTNDA